MALNTGRIGFFVTGGLALFAVGMFLIGDRHQLFARHAEYYSEFANLAGLSTGAKVKVAGMDAGEVLSIAVPDSPSSRFRLRWRINSKMAVLVRADSVVTIGTEGVVGGTYLSVRPGTSHASQVDVLATIPSKEPLELSDVVANGARLVDDVRATLRSVGSQLNGALEGITTTVSNVNDVVVGLKEGRGVAGMLLRDNAVASDLRDVVTGVKEGRGVAGMLLRDEALAGQVRTAISNAQNATVSLGHASQQADALVSDLNARGISRKAGEIVDNLSDSTRHINQVVAQMTTPDQQGLTAGANIRETLTNANAATANLADATEALKHNFLTRGFFKDRGYYTLGDMSPDQYRKDRVFTTPANPRVWLAASELFEGGSNGDETLSVGGKEVLEAAFADYGDMMLESPIVVEGYWNGQSGKQLQRSHNRALLVRQYIQARFRSDMKNLGVVPLKNTPPSGLGRSMWDGVCLVILKAK